MAESCQRLWLMRPLNHSRLRPETRLGTFCDAAWRRGMINLGFASSSATPCHSHAGLTCWPGTGSTILARVRIPRGRVKMMRGSERGWGEIYLYGTLPSAVSVSPIHPKDQIRIPSSIISSRNFPIPPRYLFNPEVNHISKSTNSISSCVTLPSPSWPPLS